MDGDSTQGLAWSYRINSKCFKYRSECRKKMISCRAAFIWMLLGKRESSEIMECSRMLHIDGFLKESHQRTQFSLNFIVMY